MGEGIMVTYIKSDLQFILDQIKISEAHAAGQPLYGPGGLIPTYNLAWGLRTVDGSYNHLLPGQEQWGAADNPFPELLDPEYRTIMVDPDGVGPSPAVPITYTPGADADGPGTFAEPGDVIDPEVRTISNLLVDQTLGNPAAILTALQRAGADPAQQLTIAAEITAAYDPISPLFQAVAVAERNDAAASAAAAASPGNAALQQAAAAAAAALETAQLALDAADDGLMALLALHGIELDGANVHLPNVAPDEGLSASFNSWFTLFGQFFDHGLDLVNKGGSGTVMIPLQPDDPLYVPGSSTNFMVLTRATVGPGADGVMLDDPNTAIDESADNTRPVNTTTAYVDQNQTYTSHPSHQVFLRQYVLTPDGPAATGMLIEGANGGMANWGELKVQARDILGIELTDDDVGRVPLLRTDPYGNFIPGPNGYPQVIYGLGTDGIPNTNDDLVMEGNPAAPIDPSNLFGAANPEDAVGAIRTNHAFLADIAHNAVPTGLQDGDITIGLGNPENGPAEPGAYDNELLDAHFVAGDGRVNENIGLTAVHHVFHAEHNRLVEHTKETVLADAQALFDAGASPAESVAFLNEWLVDDVTAIPADLSTLVWDGERLFQAAKFGTEMQYQHLVFEEFARKVQPTINTFLVPDGFDTTLDPSIVAEFAHVVYRFGHSMLTETIDRFDPAFGGSDISLIEGFLNPTAFNGINGAIDDGIAAGAIIRGMTRQVGNEIDEFVTSALRNNLLGLPLDLATINLARGRDTGVPSLNAARRDFYEASNQNVLLKPYESWVDFAGHLKHEASIINFIAAYGTHALITSQTTLEGRRDAALTIITGVSVGGLEVPADASDFLNGLGAYGPAGALGGLENVDLWIGGLAEEIMPFGGMLGSTFNFVFEVQMEMLQSGDRFYYLQRLDGLHLFGEMENNSFAAMMMRNTDATHLPSDVFSTPGLILEVDQTRQFNDLDGDGILESTDPTGTGILTPLVVRNNPATPEVDTNYLRYNGDDHVVLGGTEADDTLISGIGDDTLYGDGGDDRLDGGFGNDILNGGEGDDIIVDAGGDDNVKAGSGNDVVHAGPGLDLVMGGAGQDFIFLGTDEGSEVFAGEGNDFVYGNKNAERILGNEGNDWIETGTFDGAPGDNFDEIFAHDGIDGHDVFLGDGGFDEFIGEGGDDIFVGSAGRGKMVGMSGFDWATYKDNPFAVNANLSIPIIFDESPVLPENAALDEFESVEGLSGTAFNDTLTGTDETAATLLPMAQGGSNGYQGSILDAEGIALIAGLQAVLGAGVTEFGSGDIILGGDGSDLITGRAGDDVIDGDKWLNVRIAVHQNIGPNGGIGPVLEYHESMTTLAAAMFAGDINPGQLRIHREIMTDETAGDTDVAVFSDDQENYTITANADGSITVAHTTVSDGLESDGTDRINNIETLRFRDGDLSLVKPVVQLHAFDVDTYQDDFETENYGNTNGTTTWDPDWTETGDNNSVTDGQIQIDDNGGGNGVLRFDSGDGATITRTVPLAGATAATLVFSVNEQNLDGLGDNDNIVVQFSSDGTTWSAPLQTINSATGSTTMTVALPGPFTATSAIRFVASSFETAGADDIVEFGDVRVEFSRPAAAPTVDYETTYTENGAGVAIADGPSITDDGTTLASARIVLTNAQSGDDFDWGVLPDGISAALDDSVEGQLTVNLTGTATLAAYQTAIQAITFDSSSENPSAVARIIEVTVNDGFAESEPAITTINVTAVNDAPNGALDSVITNFGANQVFNIPEWALLANDVDPEGSPLNITAANGASGLNSLSLVGDNIEVSDNGIVGGSFNYNVTDGTTSDNANTVTITRDNAGDVTGTGTANIMIGNTASSTFDAQGGNDIVLAGAGADTIDAGTGDDRVLGEAGVDTIVWNANAAGDTDGFDIVDGGLDTDTFDVNTRAFTNETYRVYTRTAAEAAGIAIVSATTEIVITRQVGGTTSIIAELDNIEEIRIGTQTGDPSNGGAGGGDTVQIFGDFSETSLSLNTITIDGNAGDDTIDISGLSSDHRIVFRSNGGNDTIIGALRPQDVIELPAGMVIGDFEVTIDDDGLTTLVGDGHTITFVAPDGMPQFGDEGEEDEGETPPSAGSVKTGTSQADVLLGTTGDDSIVAFAGDDVAMGDGGNDNISAGEGVDFVNGGEGADTIFAGSGDDQVFGGGGADTIFGDAGADRIFGDAGNDTIAAGAGDDTVFGGAGNDRFVAEIGDGNDVYIGDGSEGGTGNDTLDMSAATAAVTVNLGVGPLGNGTATGSQVGSDTLWGIENVNTGSGNDTITASNAANVINGGAGNDVFRFNTTAAANGDTILGFEPGDRLDLSGIDASLGAAGDQAFTILSGGAFTAAGQLAVSLESRDDGDFTVIQGNVNGDLAADFRIEVEGHHTLSNANTTL
jgi:Ca2+-binding RTX toxin-like protein